MTIGEKNKSWSKTLNIIQSSDDTVAAKAMYSQFEKNTILNASRISDGRRNLVRDDNDGEDEDGNDMEESGPVVLPSLFPLLNRITLTSHSLNFLSIIA